jgi:hypothetical protein
MAAFTNSTAPGSDFGGRARRLVSVYVNRRLPWGTPWWIDAVALGAANVVRQFVVPDVADSIELAIFVAMVGVVFAAVTVVHTRLWRRAAEPSSNQRRQRPEAATPIVDQPAADGPARRWAPWWWLRRFPPRSNYLRQALVPGGTLSEWAVVVLVVAMSAVPFAIVTIVFRAAQRRRDSG